MPGRSYFMGAALSVALMAPAHLGVEAQRSPGVDEPIVRVGKRVQLSAATLFSFNREDAFSPIGGFVDATQLALRVYNAGSSRIKGVGVEVTHVTDGQFPWPMPTRSRVPLDHDGGLRVTGNVYISSRQGERVDVDLVVGAGVRRWKEGDGIADFTFPPQDGVFRIQSQTDPILTYGLLADFSLTDIVSLQGQVRANTAFAGSIDVLGPDNEAETVEAGTQTHLHVMAGVAVRLGGR